MQSSGAPRQAFEQSRMTAAPAVFEVRSFSANLHEVDVHVQSISGAGHIGEPVAVVIGNAACRFSLEADWGVRRQKPFRDCVRSSRIALGSGTGISRVDLNEAHRSTVAEVYGVPVVDTGDKRCFDPVRVLERAPP
jgi:hypothetical protein